MLFLRPGCCCGGLSTGSRRLAEPSAVKARASPTRNTHTPIHSSPSTTVGRDPGQCIEPPRPAWPSWRPPPGGPPDGRTHTLTDRRTQRLGTPFRGPLLRIKFSASTRHSVVPAPRPSNPGTASFRSHQEFDGCVAERGGAIACVHCAYCYVGPAHFLGLVGHNTHASTRQATSFAPRRGGLSQECKSTAKLTTSAGPLHGPTKPTNKARK